MTLCEGVGNEQNEQNKTDLPLPQRFPNLSNPWSKHKSSRRLKRQEHFFSDLPNERADVWQLPSAGLQAEERKAEELWLSSAGLNTYSLCLV